MGWKEEGESLGDPQVLEAAEVGGLKELELGELQDEELESGESQDDEEPDEGELNVEEEPEVGELQDEEEGSEAEELGELKLFVLTGS